MNYLNTTLSAQEAARITNAMKSVISGLHKVSNEYSITATHAGARTGRVFTQYHTLTNEDVAHVRLRVNHCEIIFRPSLRRAVLFLPYDAIEDVSCYDHATPDNLSLFVAERIAEDVLIGYEPEYGMASA